MHRVSTNLENPGIVREFCKPGKVREFEIWSGKFFYDVIFCDLLIEVSF